MSQSLCIYIYIYIYYVYICTKALRSLQDEVKCNKVFVNVPHKSKTNYFFAGVDKLNDAPKDVLVVVKRLQNLAECERTPRTYKKQNPDY